MHCSQNHGRNVLIVVVICVATSIRVDSSKSQYNHLTKEASRQSRNFFPFVWVTFPPSPCGIDHDGTCVQAGKCKRMGGMANGECQNSFGECCFFKESCTRNRTRVDVNQLVTTLESPSSNDVGFQCSYRFRKEANICQIRLDFKHFSFTSANLTGDCEIDRLRIQNSITVDSGFTTCGMLTGEHMYLTFGSQDMIEVMPLQKIGGSSYKIVATKIPCNSINLAPDYCLQYYTGLRGRVKSLDFGRQQQNNQKYNVCVKPTDGQASIRWNLCQNESDALSIATIVTEPDRIVVHDFIQIKGEDRMFDNLTHGLPHTTSVKPFELIVHFDGMELPANLPFPPTSNPCLGCFSSGMGCTVTDASGKEILTSDMCSMPYVLPITCACDAPTPPPSHIDIENRGFCLDFEQQ